METNRIRQFCVVAETGNLRKAADILGISHSAISKSMKVLQSELKISLMSPSGRNIAITDEGIAFLEKAKRFLNEEALLLSQEPQAISPIRIATFEVFSTHFLGSLWRKYFKDAFLDLHELLPGHLEEALADRKVDLGLTYEPIPKAGIEFIRIGKVEMNIFKRIGTFPSVRSADLPFVAPISPIVGTPTGMKGLDGWPDDSMPRNIQFKVDMMESALALVRNGVAAIFAPNFVVHFHNRSTHPNQILIKQERPQGMKPVFRDVYLVKRVNYSENSHVRMLARMIRTECIGK